VPASPATRAAAASARGKNIRLLPKGARTNGSSSVVPSTVVRRSHPAVATADRGRNVTCSNARQFSRSVISASAPPSM
jgi:hypothetical protein